MAYKPETQALLVLTAKPYDEYNAILPLIRQRLEAYGKQTRNELRVYAFNRTLGEELPFNPLRRSTRIAILVAMGEAVEREKHPTPAFLSERKRKRAPKK